MELVALDLKRSGKFIARTLSYEGVEFRRVRLADSPLKITCASCLAHIVPCAARVLPGTLKLAGCGRFGN
jgi:P-loop containing NTP hydrolase pore-1